MKVHIIWGVVLWTVISGCIAAGQSTPAAAASSPAKTLTEKEAAHVMDGMRKALESNRPNRLTAMFDPARMPEFPVFRDQLEQFFTRYESVRVRYHVDQIAQDGGFGSIVSEFFLEALPVSDGLPGLRRRAQMRVVLAWDGSEWKIADLSPRNFFQ